MDTAKMEQLRTRLARISDLNFAGWLLGWDQRVMMPPGGAQARGDQMGTLAGLAHEFFIDEEVGALLEDLAAETAALPYESDEASLVRVKQREYERLVRVPTSLVMRITQAGAEGHEAWVQARSENRFSIFEPHLSKMVDLQRELAAALGSETGNPYDALLDQFEPGLTYEYINGVFGALKTPLVALVKAIGERADAVDDSVLRREYPEAAQVAFSREIAEALGFDFQRGRLDKSAHPFTSGTSRDDVRLTTRVDERFLPTCVMAVIHEAGHGMHMQNYHPALYRSSMEFPGLAIAESQSRFFENVVGRSRAFWTYWYPRAQAHFPHLADVPLETFYRAINKSQPSLIRVEADEVTYGLHIMLRFELENDVINGRVAVADLPREWNDRMETYLGVRPPTDSDGVLQDIHWSQGGWGYFPDYLLGSILASQLWDALRRERPGVEAGIARGEFAPLLEWQREQVMQHGAKFTFPELVERATGRPLSWEPYMNYLTAKYGEIYGL